MIEMQTTPLLIRKAKLGEMKLGTEFGDYARLKFMRSDDPMPHTGGQSYTLFICNKQKDVLYETHILKYDI